MLNIYELFGSIDYQGLGLKLIYTALMLLGVKILSMASKLFFFRIKEINPDNNGYEDLIPFLGNLIRIIFYVLGLYVFLKIWGIDVGPLVASAGVAGLAIAFAAQDSIANLFGGISIFIDKPFKVGDQILIDGTNTRGIIEKVGARSTKISTLDNTFVTVPNSVIINNPIYNETGLDPKVKLRITVGVSYNSDLEHVEKVLYKILKAEEGVLDDPEPVVLFSEFAASSINILIVSTVQNPSEKFKVQHKLIKQIHKSFRAEKIEIPYPQIDLHTK